MTDAPGAMIQVDGLTRRYGPRTVLQDVSFAVAAGEIVSVVGPSGCGKTTLLRSIAGLAPPSEGTVCIGGREVTGPPEGVAMVFQHFGLFPWKTVFGNVAYGLTVAGVRRKDAEPRVRQLISLVGLDGFEKSYPYQLSGGMQQRAGLARALAIEPQVLIMDEPFASLDAQTRDLLQLELLRIWEQRPAAMVFVTHSIDEAVLMGDRIVILGGQARPRAGHRGRRHRAAAGPRGPGQRALPGRARSRVDHGHAEPGRPGPARGRTDPRW